MAQDPYEVLGLTRQASADDIKRAYRGLARKYHPDLNPDDTEAEARFKAANAAHGLLSDPEKRARYDRGEIDADEQERGPPPGSGGGSWRTHAEGAHGDRYRWQGGGESFDAGGFEDFFGDYFRHGAAQDQAPGRGRDAQYVLTVRFIDTVRGATNRLTLPDGRTLDVRIPPGIETGQVLRLRGRGNPGRNGGPDGDALVEISVAPDPVYTRNGQDILLDLPVDLREVVLGERVTVPTPHGNVAMKVPDGADTGRVMRLRGKGMPARRSTPAGDLLVTLRVQVGVRDAKLADFLRDWKPDGNVQDPRASLWAALKQAGDEA